MISIKSIEYGNKRVWFQWFQDEWLFRLVPSFGSAYGSDNLWVYHFCAALGFGGAVLLGDVWQQAKEAFIPHFLHLKQLSSHPFNF